jgi:hypothetical protein
MNGGNTRFKLFIISVRSVFKARNCWYIGCQGDYSSFSQLGQEVNNAITTIKKYLGNHTEIVLLGHSGDSLASNL